MRYGRSENRQFSPRAARCLGGTVHEGGGRLSSALSVGYTQSLACFRQVAESAETVEVIIPHLEGSKNGGICCYRTQSGSAHLPLSPGSEGQPAIRPWFSPDKGTLLRASSRRFSFEFFGFWPPRGKACYYFIYPRPNANAEGPEANRGVEWWSSSHLLQFEEF